MRTLDIIHKKKSGGELTDELAERIRSLTETYGRIVPEPKPKSEKTKKAK